MAWGQDFQSRYGLVRINIDFIDAILIEFNAALPQIEKVLSEYNHLLSVY